MAYKEELNNGRDNIICYDCRIKLYLKVLESAAGYYLGYFCKNCGPYGRITEYYNTRKEADDDLIKYKNGETILKLRKYSY